MIKPPRLMMTTGPVEVSPRVLSALSRRVIHHSRPEFRNMYDDLLGDLQRIWKSRNDMIVLHGEGILGIEASIASMIDRGEEVIIASPGVFGYWFKQIIEAHEGVPMIVSSDPAKEADIEAFKAAIDEHSDAALVIGVHCETVSSVVNPIAEICKISRKAGIPILVDVIASVGGQETPTDVWKADLCVGSSQHCLSCPPGLSQISVSPEAWERMRRKKRPVRNSYLSILDMQETWTKGKYFPYTPLVSEVYALSEACKEILEEGLENVFTRHHDAAEASRRGVEGMGLRLFPVDSRYAADVVTTFRIPENMHEERLLDDIAMKHGILLAGGFRELKGKVIRIGHSGYSATVPNVIASLAALETEFRTQGFRCEPGSAVKAALE